MLVSGAMKGGVCLLRWISNVNSFSRKTLTAKEKCQEKMPTHKTYEFVEKL